jgi:hypothetical protein
MLAFFVWTKDFSNWSWNPESVRTGRLVKSLRNSMTFFVED